MNSEFEIQKALGTAQLFYIMTRVVSDTSCIVYYCSVHASNREGAIRACQRWLCYAHEDHIPMDVLESPDVTYRVQTDNRVTYPEYVVYIGNTWEPVI